MPTSVKENYLKALYFLNEKSNRINITDLSKKLGVSKPTASNMIRNLEYHGWVEYQKYRPVVLTKKGKKAAALVIRKHRLTEMFLNKIMGFGWEEVHEVAEQMEHIESEKLFNRLAEMLENPSYDPHGSPIPDENGEIKTKDLQNLSSVSIGQKAILVGLAESSSELLHYLNECKIGLGSVMQMLKKEPFDGSCTIHLNGHHSFVISKKVADKLLIETQ